MFSIGHKLYRFSDQSGELVLSYNDDSKRQWRAIHLPSALRIQTLQDLCLAKGASSIFILSRPEQKVYHMYSDMSFSKKISYINMEAMSNRINSIAYVDGSYCIMGFTLDMHGYIICGKTGGRFLSFNTAPGTISVEIYPKRVISVNMIPVGKTIYALVHCDQMSYELLQVDVDNCICTYVATYSFEYATKILYVFEANSYIVAICSSKSMISSNVEDHAEHNSTASFALSMSSSRVAGSLYAVVFKVPSSPAPVAKQQSRTASLLTDLPEVFRKECIYHNGSLVAFDGSIIMYEPLNRLISIPGCPDQAGGSKSIYTKESAANANSFSMNLSEVSRNSDKDNDVGYNSLCGPILRQSTGFGDNRGKHNTHGDVIPLSDALQDIYEYLGVPIEEEYVTFDLLAKGLIGAVAKLRATELAAAEETMSLKKQIDELKESLDGVKKDKEVQMNICKNFNTVIDDLMIDRSNTHNSLAKIEANIAELAQQQLIVAAKRSKQSTQKKVGSHSDWDGNNSLEKDLTTSDISATATNKREVSNSNGIHISTQTKKVTKAEKVKRSTSSSTKINQPSYKDVEMIVQQTLRSLSPTKRVIQPPPQPMLYSMLPSSSLMDKTSRSGLEVELLLLRDENERLRKKSAARSISTPATSNYNLNPTMSPSSLAERLRFVTKKMDSSMGRARKIETALDSVDKSGHAANLDIIHE